MTDAVLQHRRRVHAELGAKLSALSDEELAALATPGPDWRQGVGGRSGAVDVGGHRVHVKSINLTDIERANPGSTANLFDLPLCYQYGVGSAGFGAWRELAAYQAASDWALAGECASFPLVYHWRVLPRPSRAAPTEAQLARLDAATQYWGGSFAIRDRIMGMMTASATITMFLEYVPQTLDTWLGARLAAGPPDAATEAAILRVFDQMHAAAAFMNARAVLHFDLHVHNVLTDGEQLCVADFGLALSAAFDLSDAERAFFASHDLYDRCYTCWALVAWLTSEGRGPWTGEVAALIERCRPVVDLMGGFMVRLREDKATQYPAADLAQAFEALFGTRSPDIKSG